MYATRRPTVILQCIDKSTAHMGEVWNCEEKKTIIKMKPNHFGVLPKGMLMVLESDETKM